MSSIPPLENLYRGKRRKELIKMEFSSHVNSESAEAVIDTSKRGDLRDVTVEDIYGVSVHDDVISDTGTNSSGSAVSELKEDYSVPLDRSLGHATKNRSTASSIVPPTTSTTTHMPNSPLDHTFSRATFPTMIFTRCKVSLSRLSDSEMKEAGEKLKLEQRITHQKLDGPKLPSSQPNAVKRKNELHEDTEENKPKKVIRKFRFSSTSNTQTTGVTMSSQDEAKSTSKKDQRPFSTLENEKHPINRVEQGNVEKKANTKPQVSGKRSKDSVHPSPTLPKKRNINEKQYHVSDFEDLIHQPSTSKRFLSNSMKSYLNPVHSGRKLPPIPKITKLERAKQNEDKSQATSPHGLEPETIILAKSALERPVFSERMHRRNGGNWSSAAEVKRQEFAGRAEQPNGFQHIETEMEFDFSVFNNGSAKQRRQGRRGLINIIKNDNNSVEISIPSPKSESEAGELKIDVPETPKTNLENLNFDSSDTVELIIQRVEDIQPQIDETNEFADLILLPDFKFSKEKEIEVEKLKEELSFGAESTTDELKLPKEKLIIKTFHILSSQEKEMEVEKLKEKLSVEEKIPRPTDDLKFAKDKLIINTFHILPSQKKEMEVKKRREELSIKGKIPTDDVKLRMDKLILKTFHVLPSDNKSEEDDPELKRLEHQKTETKIKNYLESGLPLEIRDDDTTSQQNKFIEQSQTHKERSSREKVVDGRLGLHNWKSKIFFRPRFHDEELDYDCIGGIKVTDLDLDHIFSSEPRIDKEQEVEQEYEPLDKGDEMQPKEKSGASCSKLDETSNVVIKIEVEDESELPVGNFGGRGEDLNSHKSSDEDCDVLLLEPDYMDDIDVFLS